VFTKNRLIFYVAFLFLIISCGFLGENSDKKSRVVARVYDAKFYQGDLEQVFPKNISEKDSVVIARSLINSWAKQELLFLKSKVNMPSENLALEDLVEKYKQDLFINSFKEALIKQKLDTVVAKSEIISYYNKNKESFKTNEELVKFKYLQIGKNIRNKRKLRRLLVSKKKDDLHLLAVREMEYKASFLNDSVWIRYRAVLNKLPLLKQFRKQEVLKPFHLIQKTDSTGLYYIYIKEILPKNEIAPIRYSYKRIREMILHKRKLDLVNEIEEVLVEDAIRNKQFEIY